MDLLRRIRPACRLFDKGVIIIISHRGNAVSFFRTYHSSTVRARQQQQQQGRSVENNNSDNRLSREKRLAIDEATIRRIEKLALVGFEYEQSKRVLEEAVAFAERLRAAHVDEAVRPMYSTLENEHIRLREDVARHDVDRREILRNAAVLEEEYFVAPLTTNRKTESE
ncbi:hypothetical protein P5V15_012289 [Pogonomyrmex californicus]